MIQQWQAAFAHQTVPAYDVNKFMDVHASRSSWKTV